MPNLYRRGKYWWCWGYYPNGDRWAASTKQAEKRAAEKAARAIERQRLLGAGQAPVTLQEALDLLVMHKRRKGVSPHTMAKTRDKGRQLMRVFGPGANVHAITLAHCEAYVEQRTSERIWEKRERTTSKHTVAMELNVLRESLRQLKRHGRYDGEPNAIFPTSLHNVYRPRDRWMTMAEYRALLDAIPEDRRDHVVAYCRTGARHSELYKIVIGSVELDGRGLFIPGTKTGDAPRWVPIHAELHPIVARRVERYGEGRLFPDVWGKGVINRTLAAACRRAGIDRVTTNDLRRTFCSWLCNAGVPEIQAQRLMGHSSSLMIRRVYGQLAPETLRGAIDRMPT